MQAVYHKHHEITIVIQADNYPHKQGSTTKILHLFMPFITEHIAGIMTERGLRKYSDPLLISKWPEIVNPLS